MDFGNLVSDLLKDQAIKAISKKTGLNESMAKSMASKALPALLGALKNNANDPKKAESLEKAVKKHDGSIFDNLDNINLQDGEKILGHVFGNDKEKVAKEVGDKSVLAALAPMVMGALGKAKTDTGKKTGDLLSGDGMMMKMATSFLDKDGDGSITDDLFDMAMGVMKK